MNNNTNVPEFDPADEMKLYIPDQKDEVLLTRDWTFTASQYWARNLFHALGLTTKQKVQREYKQYDGTTHHYEHIESVPVEGTADKMQITLKAGCILALDSLRNGYATMRLTFAPKDQGLVNKRLRPRFTVDISEVNNKLFFLPATDPDVDIEE